MHMSMKKISGLVSVNKLPERLEPPVTEVLGIMDMSGRSMGDNNVDSPVPPQQWPNFPNRASHLLLSILHGTTIVPSGAFETHYPETLEM